jgi:hypothetical protein
MRLDKITIHSWEHKELTIRSEEDWVLGFYDDNNLITVYIIPRVFRRDYSALAENIIETVSPFFSIKEEERQYTREILTASLPYMV